MKLYNIGMDVVNIRYLEQIEAYHAQNLREKNEKRVILDYIKRFPDDILLRRNEFAHMTSSGFIMNQKLDKVLFIFHKIYNTWTWTGGHTDGEQDLLKTALKEASEETGITKLVPLSNEIITLDIIPVYGHLKKGEYVCSHLHLNAAYILIADEKAKLFINENETNDIGWISINQIETYSNEPYLIEIYNRIIKKAFDLKKI